MTQYKIIALGSYVFYRASHFESHQAHPIVTTTIFFRLKRNFAMLLVRYAWNASNLMKQLRDKVKTLRDGDQNTVVLFHTLINKMPGIASQILQHYLTNYL